MEARVARRLVAAARRAAEADLACRPLATTVTRAPTASRFDPVALQAEGDEMAGVLGPVVEVGQGLVLGEDQGVDPAVVVEVADGQAAADPRDRPGRGRRGPTRR